MSALRLFCLLALLCLPPGLASAATLTDQRYGPDAAQLADVYLPATPAAPLAPILVLVHGGSWLHGDKAEPVFIQDKVARWLPLGFVVVAVTVSYTHLDVYKRQGRWRARTADAGRPR